MTRKTRLSLYLIGSLTLFCTILSLSLSPFFFSPDYFSRRAWRGYYTLLATSLSRDLVESVRSLPGVDEVVSEYTARVSFNTFNSFDSIEVARLDERLDTADPRLDPYMRGVPGFFRGSLKSAVREILYIRSDANVFFIGLRLPALLSARGIQYELLELDFTAKILLSLFFAGYAVILIGQRIEPGFKPLALLGLLPWFINVLFGGFPDLIAFFLIYPFWIFFFEKAYPFIRNRVLFYWADSSLRELFLRFIALVAIFITVIFLIPIPGSPGIMLYKNLTALAADLCLMPLIRLGLFWKRERKLHLIFEPLPVLTPRSLISGRRAAGFILAAIVLLSFPVFYLEKSIRGLSCPLPGKTHYRGGGDRGMYRGNDRISWGSLRRLSLNRDPERLPDLADFVTHRAFQEALAFGRSYTLPYPGERIYISSYRNSRVGNEIVKTLRTVKRYQSSWLKETIERIPAASIQRMLVDQKEPLRVAVQNEASFFLKTMPLWKMFLILFFNLTASILYGTRNHTIMRKQYAA